MKDDFTLRPAPHEVNGNVSPLFYRFFHQKISLASLLKQRNDDRGSPVTYVQGIYHFPPYLFILNPLIMTTLHSSTSQTKDVLRAIRREHMYAKFPRTGATPDMVLNMANE